MNDPRSSGGRRLVRALDRTSPLVAVAIVLLAVAGVKLAGLEDKRGLVHDEAIAYLAATCHQGEFHQATERGTAPFGRWVPAAEWKRFVTPEDRGCLARIGRDLAAEDIHPPLFFWVLHGWLLMVGTGAAAGPGLNILLGVLTGLALFGLARRVFAAGRPAALVTAVWALSPAAVLVFADGRQYELLALLSVLFVWQVLRFSDPDTRRPILDALLLALVTAAGALTQFQFGVVAVAGAIVLGWRLRHERRLLAAGLAAIAAGCALFALLHPDFGESLVRGGAQTPPLDPAWVGHRVGRTIAAIGGFVFPAGLTPGPGAYLGFALVLAALALTLRRLRRPPRTHARHELAPAMVGVFLMVAGAPVALYLAFATPLPAVDAKHLSFVWPFLAFVPVVLLRGRRWRVPVAAGLLAVLAAGAVVGSLREYGPWTADPTVAGAERVAIDNVARGVLLPAVWPLEDEVSVYAADQRHMLTHRAEWNVALQPGDILLSGLPIGDPRSGNGEEQGQQVVALVRRRFRLTEAPRLPLVLGRPYRLTPPAPDG